MNNLDRLVVEIEAVINTRLPEQRGDEIAFICPSHDDPKTVRFRTAIEGQNRFRWRNDSKPIPYGLNAKNIASTRSLSYSLVVEA